MWGGGGFDTYNFYGLTRGGKGRVSTYGGGGGEGNERPVRMEPEVLAGPGAGVPGGGGGVVAAVVVLANEEYLRFSDAGISGSLVQAIDVRRLSLSTLVRGVPACDGGVEVIQMKTDGRGWCRSFFFSPVALRGGGRISWR